MKSHPSMRHCNSHDFRRSADTMIDEDPFDYYFLSESRRKVWKYYRLHSVASDGYPVTRSAFDDSRTVEHPMSGAYMILEILNAVNKNTIDRRIINERAEQVALAAQKRMERFKDSYVYFYEPDDGVTPYQFKFFSALTQARYLGVIGRLYLHTKKPEHKDFAFALARSFRIPVEEGGIFLENDLGCFFEEYPTELPLYVLNGWISVLNELFIHARKLKDSQIKDLAQRSARTLANMLPLFDMPEMMSTRYKLTGPVTSRVKFDKPQAVRIEGITINTGNKLLNKSIGDSQNYGTFEIIRQPEEAQPYFQFKALLTMVRYPAASTIKLQLISDLDQECAWHVGITQYNPKFVTQKIVGFRSLGKFYLEEGMNQIELEVPLDILVPSVAPAVGFTKNIDGKLYNAYHFIHVKGLAQLYGEFALGKFKYFHRRWLDYVGKWPEFPMYSDPQLALEPWVDGGARAQIDEVGGAVESYAREDNG
jgi:hypothetical protein